VGVLRAIPTVKRRQRALRQVYFTAQESIEFRIANETRELETSRCRSTFQGEQSDNYW
jgi:hypothetical protein